MTDSRQRTIAIRVGLASALVAAVCTAVLIADHLAALSRADDESQLVEALREQVGTDHEVAAPLHEERERQTDVSMAREARSRTIAWVLLVAGGVSVACGRWYMSRRPQPLPSLDRLVAERFPPAKQPVHRGVSAGVNAGVEAPGGQGARPRRVVGPSEGAERSPPGCIGGRMPPNLRRDALDAAPSRHGAGTPPTDSDSSIDLTFIDTLMERHGRGREAAIPLLQAIQAHYRYLPDEALQHLCQVTSITPAQIAGTSSFYAQFRRSPVGRHVVRVCHGTACHVAGAEHITQELRRHLDILPDQDTDPRRLFTIDAVACLGCCCLAPVMVIEEETAGRLTPASARQTVDAIAMEMPPT